MNTKYRKLPLDIASAKALDSLGYFSKLNLLGLIDICSKKCVHTKIIALVIYSVLSLRLFSLGSDLNSPSRAFRIIVSDLQNQNSTDNLPFHNSIKVLTLSFYLFLMILNPKVVIFLQEPISLIIFAIDSASKELFLCRN